MTRYTFRCTSTTARSDLPAYFPRDEQILVDDDGTITCRECAVPEMRAPA